MRNSTEAMNAPTPVASLPAALEEELDNLKDLTLADAGLFTPNGADTPWLSPHSISLAREVIREAAAQGFSLPIGVSPYSPESNQAVAIEWKVQSKKQTAFVILTFGLPENVVEVRSRQTALRKYFFEARTELKEQASDIVAFLVLSGLLPKNPCARQGQ